MCIRIKGQERLDAPMFTPACPSSVSLLPELSAESGTDTDVRAIDGEGVADERDGIENLQDQLCCLVIKSVEGRFRGTYSFSINSHDMQKAFCR